MNNGILTQPLTAPAMPYGLLGKPLPVPMPDRSLHPEAVDWQDRVVRSGGTVSGGTMTAVSQFCHAIQAAGIRDRLYRVNLFCGGNLSACLVPLYRGTSIDATQLGNATDTNVNFAAGNYIETGSSGGLTGNAASTYLNTGLNAQALPISTSGIHVGAHLLSTTVTSGSVRSPIGVISNKVYFVGFDFRNTPATVAASDFGAYAASVNPLFPGFHIASILGTSVVGFFRVGANAFVSTDLRTSDNLTAAENFFVMARNSGGSAPSQYWGGRVGGYSIGAHLTAAQSGSLRLAFDAFQSALNRNI